MDLQDDPGTARLAICIPVYRDDATTLINALSALPEAASCAILLYDDGSDDAGLVHAHQDALAGFPGRKTLQVAQEHQGRSFARRWLVSHVRSNWILLLDAGMLPDSPDFLSRYLATADDADGPALIAGGFSLDPAAPGSDSRLYHAQTRKSDSADAASLAANPGRYPFSSNILVHRALLDAVPFDETVLGWEDIDWALRVAGRFPVIHIDNTVTHPVLETDDTLLERYGASGPHFARLAARHPEAAAHMPLIREAQRVKGIPLLAPAARAVASARFLPVPLRVFALNRYRAAVCSPFVEPA